jgi:hypothetical protein
MRCAQVTDESKITKLSSYLVMRYVRRMIQT